MSSKRFDDGAADPSPSGPSHATSPLPDDLAAALGGARDRLGCLASTILFYPTIPSTNDVALMLAARADREGAVVIADEQTAGRGRRGHAWFSPPGSGLYVSLVLAPGRAAFDRERATQLLTLTAGVAIAEGIETASALRADIKWPNDLLVRRRKLAGILAESAGSISMGVGGDGDPRSVNNIVLGYGINLAAAAYPPELGDRATSLETELGRPVDRTVVLVETLAAIASRYGDLLAGRFDAILDAWRARSPSSRGAHVTWQAPSGSQSGITAGIDDRGALLVRVGDRLERLVGGAISWS